MWFDGGGQVVPMGVGGHWGSNGSSGGLQQQERPLFFSFFFFLLLFIFLKDLIFLNYG